MIIAPDIPQKILDVFNPIDFQKIGTIEKTGMLMFIKSFCKNNLPYKKENKEYKKRDQKLKIARTFDPDLLNIINLIDWELVSDNVINDIVVMVSPFVVNMPKVSK